MLEHWRLILQPGLPGVRQMAIDETLYRLAQSDAIPVVRFYSWERPTLSLGYFQDYKRVVCEPFCVHNKIDIVRRITGGRAVLHQYEVTYAIVAPLQHTFEKRSLQETYQLIAEALNLGLQSFGVDQPSIFAGDTGDSRREARLSQCFVSVSQFEHSSNSRKIIGSAQKRSRDRFLQHGSILLGFDPYLQKGCVHRPDPQIESKIAPLNHVLQRSVDFPEAASRFARAFETKFQVLLGPSSLSETEERLVCELESKYQSDEWTLGSCK